MVEPLTDAQLYAILDRAVRQDLLLSRVRTVLLGIAAVGMVASVVILSVILMGVG